MTERYFAPCPRGLEAELALELAELGAQNAAAAEGGVAFDGDLALAYRANLESRLASRILWRVGGGAYRNERDVHALARAIAWPSLFRPDRTLRVDVAATRSPLRSLEFATLTIKDAVCDRCRDDTGTRPSVDKRAPDVRVFAHLTDREATLYLDTSASRCSSVDTGATPRRRRFAKTSPPGCCVSPDGRPAIRSSIRCAAAGPLPSRRRCSPPIARRDCRARSASRSLPGSTAPAWQRMKQAARDRVKAAPPLPVIHGSDTAQAAVGKTLTNANHAHVAAFIAVERADALSRSAPAPSGTLVTNPPYGVRLDDRDKVAALYPQLGDALKQRFSGWNAWLLSGDTRLPKLFGLRASHRIPLYNGALECRLYGYRIVSGPMLK
jgi:putative N6-adenine-specific DNA methylase